MPWFSIDVAPVEHGLARGLLGHGQAGAGTAAAHLIEAVVIGIVGGDKGHHGLLAVAVKVAGSQVEVVARPPVFRVVVFDPARIAREFVVGVLGAVLRILHMEDDFVRPGIKADVGDVVLPARAGGVKGDGLHKGQCSEAVVVVLILAEAAVYAVLSKGAGDRVAFAVPAVVPQKRVVVTVAVDAVDAQLGHLVHQEGLVHSVAVGVFSAVGVKLRGLSHVQDAIELGRTRRRGRQRHAGHQGYQQAQADKSRKDSFFHLLSSFASEGVEVSVPECIYRINVDCLSRSSSSFPKMAGF